MRLNFTRRHDRRIVEREILKFKFYKGNIDYNLISLSFLVMLFRSREDGNFLGEALLFPEKKKTDFKFVGKSIADIEISC